MHAKAYEAQCDHVASHIACRMDPRGSGLTLFALALGSFCIGTSEFASMGVIQLFAGDLGLSIPEATDAITAYALGVVIGAPLVTLMAARLNRRVLLLRLIALFMLGNLLSALASNIESLIIARFISGLPQGAYFGAGAVVASYVVGAGRAGKAFALVMTGLTIATIIGSPLATFLGQTLGWRETYAIVSALSGVAFAALLAWVPRADALNGGPLTQELAALRKRRVWNVLFVAAIGVASIFAVYTFIGPLVTDVTRLSARFVPIALGLFGIGMAIGNLVGGRLADGHSALGLVIGFGFALVTLAGLALFGTTNWVLFPGLFGVGLTMMTAIPTIQVRLTRAAPEAPTLMGAMNLASLNVANALGAWAGAIAVGAGFGLLSAAWAGFALTSVGLLLFGLTFRRAPETAPA